MHVTAKLKLYVKIAQHDRKIITKFPDASVQSIHSVGKY